MSWISELVRRKRKRLIGSSTMTPGGQRIKMVTKCIICYEKMTEDQKLNSNGKCPHCGSQSASNVCDTIEEQEFI